VCWGWGWGWGGAWGYIRDESSVCGVCSGVIAHGGDVVMIWLCAVGWAVRVTVAALAWRVNATHWRSPLSPSHCQGSWMLNSTAAAAAAAAAPLPPSPGLPCLLLPGGSHISVAGLSGLPRILNAKPYCCCCCPPLTPLPVAARWLTHFCCRPVRVARPVPALHQRQGTARGNSSTAAPGAGVGTTAAAAVGGLAAA
jgi:hypothetical protein